MAKRKQRRTVEQLIQKNRQRAEEARLKAQSGASALSPIEAELVRHICSTCLHPNPWFKGQD